ncbi:mannose-6-phosphate isomerase, class I (plasmid) [Coraliomargarita sp. W4R53]
MFIQLTNQPRNYAWGSPTAIAEFRGVSPSGGPEAEMWLGTHPGSPTQAIGSLPTRDANHATLQQWIEAEPALLGATLATQRTDLPILLKVLAAASPLSLQVHPTPEQAARGFADEEARGIPASDPSRNYKDPYPKPEIIVAVSERFEALCGFRPAVEVAEIVGAFRTADAPALAPLVELLGDATNIAATLDWLLSGNPAVAPCVAAVMALATSSDAAASPVSKSYATAREIGAHYPGDPGIIVAMLMNRVSLQRGEGLYAPAGLLHAYLSGLGIELMTASDNVVRGGLTPKHIDTAELRSLLSYQQRPAELLQPTVDGRITLYSPDAPFSLALVAPRENAQRVSLAGPAIVLADTAEVIAADGSGAAVSIPRGEAAFVSGDIDAIEISGPGRAWVAIAHA